MSGVRASEVGTSRIGFIQLYSACNAFLLAQDSN
jgi:hypothetical protein